MPLARLDVSQGASGPFTVITRPLTWEGAAIPGGASRGWRHLGVPRPNAALDGPLRPAPGGDGAPRYAIWLDRPDWRLNLTLGVRRPPSEA
ncbi:MAG: hypothetical protein JOZ41_13715 [Chloroflexi bacterium]|nr:hypothetical protein [Chloroflexota bacterium]